MAGLDLKDFSEELKALSDTISTQVRSIALGLIALVWALLTGLKDTPLQLDEAARREMLRIALVAVIALVIDYAQYLFGYLDSLRILRAAERQGKSHGTYSKSDFRYRARASCFWLKQIATVAGAAWMGWAILKVLR